MVKKRLIKILKLSALIGVRQTYFLGRNWYWLLTQPYPTIKQISISRDKSQIFLIGTTALTPAIVYVISRIIYDLIVHGQILWMTGNIFLVAGMIQLMVFIYLGYWILQVLRKEN